MLINSWDQTRTPLSQFSDFKFVGWEKDIYPRYKGIKNQPEIDFLCNIITNYDLSRIVDFSVGGGVEINNILKTLELKNYKIEKVEGNEIDLIFIEQAKLLFHQNNNKVIIHKSDWGDFTKAEPPYTTKFNFGFLIGNSLTYVGGRTRKETGKIQHTVIKNINSLIEKDGYFLVDTRDYDYIASIINLPFDQLVSKFTFTPTVYYHGAQKEILLVPVYIDETRICLHYYDIENKKWSLLQMYRVYHDEIVEALTTSGFTIEKVLYDFSEQRKDKNAFIQYLAKKV